MLEQRIQQQFFDSADLKVAAADVLSGPIADAVHAIVGSITSGGKVMACGNGGSAADAQHFAAEFVGRFERERPGLAAMALTTDTSILTAVGNDYDFASIFSKQVEALGHPGDVLLAITTSGNSANVLAAVDAAHAREMVVVALTGRNGGLMNQRAGRIRHSHLRAARPHHAHSGSSSPGDALHLRRGRPATARRAREGMKHFPPFCNGARSTRGALLAASLAALMLTTGCAPLLLGGALVGGGLMASDRRTSGAQLDDQAIEVKARNRVRDVIGEQGYVGVTSYNRILLITGEVPTDADKAAIESSLRQIENVRSVVNELAAGFVSSWSGRSTDALLTTRVKSAVLAADNALASHIKVVSERGTVFLMGRVSEPEAQRATDIARAVTGVQKVVRVFELIGEAELPKAEAGAGTRPSN